MPTYKDFDLLEAEINKINCVDYGGWGSWEAHSAVKEVIRDIVRIMDNIPSISLSEIQSGGNSNDG